jgi:hypothetical protein
LRLAPKLVMLAGKTPFSFDLQTIIWKGVYPVNCFCDGFLLRFARVPARYE